MRRQGPDQEGGRGVSGGEAGSRLAGLGGVEVVEAGWCDRVEVRGYRLCGGWLQDGTKEKTRERVMHSAIGVQMGRHTGLDGPR